MFRRYLLLIRLFLIRNGYKRATYLRKIKYFHRQGKDCYFQPYNFGTEPKLISFGDNVYLAAGVRIVTHDVIALMLRKKLNREDINERVGALEFGDNVFIGSDTTILYDVKIGSNVVVAAGSLVTKDLPDNSICAGRPAKVIGNFQEYENRMLEYSQEVPWKQWTQSKKQISDIQEKYFWQDEPVRPFPKRSK